MRVFLLSLLCTAACGGGDFAPPGPPDGSVERDLSVGVGNQIDIGCFSTACGGCSTWARPDGTPAMSGDPCLYAGTLGCMGTALVCSSTSCPSCAQPMTGTICGADGHTILEFANAASCSVFSTNSASAICNHGPSDGCVHRCTASAGGYDCTAHCLSDADAGTAPGGCAHQATDTCTNLASCP